MKKQDEEREIERGRERERERQRMKNSRMLSVIIETLPGSS